MRSLIIALSFYAAIAAAVTGCTTGPRSAGAGQFLPEALRRAPAIEHVIHSFGAAGDGTNPYASLIDVKDELYGTTSLGGKSQFGTVFKITPSGNETVLYSFAGFPDAEFTQSPLLDIKDSLYGTSCCGGAHQGGTVFKIKPSRIETVLYSFNDTSADNGPEAGLTNVNGTLYGTEHSGGTYNAGTVFSITTSGTENVLHSFTGSDGAGPAGKLLNVNGELYGTTSGGGAYNRGAVFKITTSGIFKLIYSFSYANYDGMAPYAGLIDINGRLYGTTLIGGTHDDGTVFSVTTSGTEKVLHSFTGPPDGEAPAADLIYANGKFFGTTTEGGKGSVCVISYGSGCGTVFSIDASGKESVVYAFGGSPDGAIPYSSLTVINDTAYGTTLQGGAYKHSQCYLQFAGCGTVFKVTL